MLDTLKLSKRLTDAHMPAEQAEALADALAQGLRESYITREHFDGRLDTLESRFDTRLDAFRSDLDARLAKFRNDVLVWMVGTVVLGTFVNHWWR